VRRLDLLRRRADIVEAVTEVNGALVWGTPKGHERRAVPVPRFPIDELVSHLAGRDGETLVFPGSRGAVLRVRTFRRGGFDAAAQQIGLNDFHPHGLRHTAASLAIAAGANVKVVQQMLGHKSATMTLDLYGHLFPDQLDEVGDALDAAARATDVSPMCPKPDVTAIRARQQTTQIA
jgi:integrase